MKRTLKLFLALLTVLLLFSSTLVGANNADPVADTEAPSSTHIIGDVTNDGLVKSLDAAMILRYDANLSSAESIGTKVPCTKAVKAFIDENLHLWVEFSDGKKINGGYAAEKPDVAGLSYVGKYAIVGDTNGDGKITALDAAMTLRYDAGLSSTDIMATKVSGNTVVDAYIDDASHCWVVLSDGGKLDAGYVGAKTYTVTFVDYDGTVLKTETVESGSAATAPVAPVREGFTFMGWDKTFDNITENTTVTATYESIKYTVNFVDYNGTVLKTETVENGKSATAPTAPTREGYTFTGWDKSFDSITADTTVTATYESAKKYTVNFVDFDGTLLKSETVNAGASVSAPVAPAREGFRFIGWSGTAVNVNSDITIIAQYVQQFSVSFVDYNDTVLKTETVENGKSATAPTAPTRPYYTFLGWDKSFVSVTSDLVVNAMYEENTHTVTYYNTKGNAIPNQYTMYSEKDGLHLPDPETVTLTAEGYNFAGWYTKSEGGEKLDDIPVGGSVTKLYAHWTAIEYTITYNKSAVHSNPPTYTVEDEIIISNPEWSGLAFTKWLDHSGKVEFYTNGAGEACARIPKGTTGNIELTAQWESYRNRVVPSDKKLVAPVYDELTGKYYFLYELGTIENVVLALNGDSEQKTGNEEITLTITKGQEIQEGVAKELGTTIANSVTQTQSWSDTTTWAESLSSSKSLDVTVGLEGNIDEILKASLQASFGMSISEASEWSETHGTGGGFEINGVETEQLTSTVSYTSTMTTSSAVTRTINGDMPDGYYSYVYACNVRVFAVVSYNAVTGDYGIDTYSVLDNMHNTLLYYPTVEDYNNASPNSLAFELDNECKTEIETIIGNSYFIKYDGNGGVYNDNGDKTDKYIYLHECGKERAIANCNYTKTGYVFNIWERITENGVTYFAEGELVTDLANAGELITLSVNWSPIKVTVNLNANGGNVTTTQLTVTYDGRYSTLPSPTRTGYTFKGWMLNGNVVTATTKVETAETHTLIANWEANTYTVIYNSNGGTGSMSNSTHVYDTSKALSSNVFSKSQYAFVGWSTNSAATTATYTNGQSVKNLATSGNVTLFAVWVKVSASADFSGRTIELAEGDVHTDHIATGMSKQQLLDNGYTTIRIELVYDTKAEDAVCFDQCQIAVVTNGTAICGENFALIILGTSWKEDIHSTYEIDVSSLNADGSFDVRWSHFEGTGIGEHWFVGSTTVTVTALQ